MMKFVRTFILAWLLILLAGMSGNTSLAQDTVPAQPVTELVAPELKAPTIDFQVNAERILILAAAAFVLTLVLHVGLAMYEGGLTRKKFVYDGVIRKVLLFAVGILATVLLGYAIKGGEPHTTLYPTSLNWAYLNKPNQITLCDLFIFSLWSVTTLTVVTGAMTERVKLKGFLIFSALFSAFLFPIIHLWSGESSWLGAMEGDAGFRDLGAGAIHTVGGAMALAGAMVLGARLNKFKNGKAWAFPGHNVILAAAGVAVVWLGWGGALVGYFASFEKFALLAMNYSISGLAAMVAAAGATLFVYKKADFSISLTGFLGGLVAATGAIYPVYNAVAIGLVAGLLVVWSIGFLEKIRLDDPIGAIPIHLLCGIWGSLAVGILGEEASIKQFLYQLSGVAALGVLAFGFAFVVFTTLKALGCLRVSEEEELERGLNLSAEEAETVLPPAEEPTPETKP